MDNVEERKMQREIVSRIETIAADVIGLMSAYAHPLACEEDFLVVGELLGDARDFLLEAAVVAKEASL